MRDQSERAGPIYKQGDKMKILVLIKEVPDMQKVEFDSERGRVNRANAPAEINPFDENALETACELKKAREDVDVTALTMGPPRAEGSLRIAYARGADHGILLTDAKFGGADTCATSKTLAAAIRKKGGYDLILCGEKSVDGDTAQVGAEVAEFLGIPHCYYVEKIDKLTSGHIEVTAEDLWGMKQTRRMPLPALVSVTKNITTPKLPTVRRRLESREIEIEKMNLSSLEDILTPEETGAKGSPTKVNKVVIPPEVKRESLIFREETDAFMDALASVLLEKGLV